MPLKIYRRGEIWHYRGTVAGRRLRGSCRTADKRTAQRIAAEKEGREWKCSLDGPESVLSFADAATLYRDARRPTRFLSAVEDYWKDTPVREINPGSVRQAAIVLYPTHSAATRNRQAIVPTQAVINHAAELELCPPLKMKRFPVERKEREPATWEWICAFMDAARPNLAALACFMFLTGARIGEATALTWDDVDLSRRRALIRQTKIGDERRTHLPPELVVALANIRSAPNPYRSRPDLGLVFGYTSADTARPMWDAAVKRAGIKPLSFHACRHGFATAMLRAGVDPITTAKRGGWRSPQHVFSTYGHALEDETVTDRITGSPATHLVDKSPKRYKSQ